MTIEIVIDDLRLKGFYDQWERVCMALPCSRVILNSSLNGYIVNILEAECVSHAKLV